MDRRSQGISEATYTNEQFLTMATSIFEDAFASSQSLGEAFDEADEFFFQSTGLRLSPDSKFRILRSLPHLFDDFDVLEETFSGLDESDRLRDAHFEYQRHSRRSSTPHSGATRPAPATPRSGRQFGRRRSNYQQELSREAPTPVSSPRQPAQHTYTATREYAAASGRGRSQDDFQRARLHDQRWDAGISSQTTDNLDGGNYSTAATTTQDHPQDDSRRAHLHDQYWDADITSGTTTNRLSTTEGNLPDRNNRNSDLVADETVPSLDDVVAPAELTPLTASQTREPVRLPFGSSSLEHNHRSCGDSVDDEELISITDCAQSILDVIPNVSIDHVLGLIIDKTTDQTRTRFSSEQIINELLDTDFCAEGSEVQTHSPHVEVRELSRQLAEAVLSPSQNPWRSPEEKSERPAVASKTTSDAGRQRSQDVVPDVSPSSPLRSSLGAIAAHLEATITSPLQNPWHESPVESQSSDQGSSDEGSPENRRPSLLQSSIIQPPETDQQSVIPAGSSSREIPIESTASSLNLQRSGGLDRQQSSSDNGLIRPSTPHLLRRLMQAASSSDVSPAGTTTLPSSESDSDSDSHSETRSHNEVSNSSRQSDRTSRSLNQREVPRIPRSRREHEHLTIRDGSPCAEALARRSRRRVNIEGLYEYIVPERTTYGADALSHTENETQRTRNPYSVNHNHSLQRRAHQGTPTPNRPRVHFDSPIATFAQIPTNGTFTDSEDDSFADSEDRSP